MNDPIYLTIRARGVVTLPAEIRGRYHLDEPGAQLELRERDDGVFELHPYVAVPADQAWYWTERWQEMEREVDAYVKKGEVAVFDDDHAFLTALDASVAEGDVAPE